MAPRVPHNSGFYMRRAGYFKKLELEFLGACVPPGDVVSCAGVQIRVLHAIVENSYLHIIDS